MTSPLFLGPVTPTCIVPCSSKASPSFFSYLGHASREIPHRHMETNLSTWHMRSWLKLNADIQFWPLLPPHGVTMVSCQPTNILSSYSLLRDVAFFLVSQGVPLYIPNIEYLEFFPTLDLPANGSDPSVSFRPPFVRQPSLLKAKLVLVVGTTHQRSFEQPNPGLQIGPFFNSSPIYWSFSFFPPTRGCPFLYPIYTIPWTIPSSIPGRILNILLPEDFSFFCRRGFCFKQGMYCYSVDPPPKTLPWYCRTHKNFLLPFPPPGLLNHDGPFFHTIFNADFELFYENGPLSGPRWSLPSIKPVQHFLWNFNSGGCPFPT